MWPFSSKKTINNQTPTPAPELSFAERQALLEARAEEAKVIGGLPTKVLEFGVWYTHHKKDFFLVLAWTLATVASVTWGYCLYFLGDYLLHGLKQEQENAQVLSQSITANPRSTENPDYESAYYRGLSVGENSYDFIGTITNKSEKNWLTFSYYFEVDGQPTDVQTSFVFPGETKYLVSLNQTVKGTGYNANLIIKNVGINFFTMRNMPDWESYKAAHLNFVIQDKEFVSGSDNGLSERLAINKLKFSVLNETSYTYKQAVFLVLSKSGTEIVSVDKYFINDFKSKTKRLVDSTITGNLGRVDSIEIIPDINIMDKNNYGKLY